MDIRDERALRAAIDKERQYLLTDASTEEFIEEYCKIESKDTLGQPAIPFKLWPSQKQALKELKEYRLNIILKARQLGFTWLVVCYIVHQCLKFGGYTALILSETETKSKELVNRVDFVLRLSLIHI